MNKQQLTNNIWAAANTMRSKKAANEYTGYILGFISYKYLSDTEESSDMRMDGAEILWKMMKCPIPQH